MCNKNGNLRCVFSGQALVVGRGTASRADGFFSPQKEQYSDETDLDWTNSDCRDD